MYLNLVSKECVVIVSHRQGNKVTYAPLFAYDPILAVSTKGQLEMFAHYNSMNDKA